MKKYRMIAKNECNFAEESMEDYAKYCYSCGHKKEEFFHSFDNMTGQKIYSYSCTNASCDIGEMNVKILERNNCNHVYRQGIGGFLERTVNLYSGNRCIKCGKSEEFGCISI